MRYEDYDDFDSETVWKVAAQYDVTDNFGLRGSIGTAFRAPTPGQQGTIVTTRLPAGVPLAGGIFPAGGSVAAALGAFLLTPELSDNITIGFTAEIGTVDLAVDFYSIDIEDRMYPTSTQSVSTDPSAGAAYDNFLALQGAGVEFAGFLREVHFFASAFDTKTEGVDVVATTPIDWGDAGVTTLTASMNYNKSSLDRPTSQVSEFLNAEEQFDFENFAPNYRGITAAEHEYDRFSMLVRLNCFGDYENSNSSATQRLDGAWYTDIEGRYRINDNIPLSVGARNLFDQFPDEDELGDLYGRNTRLDWQGALYYGRLNIDF